MNISFYYDIIFLVWGIFMDDKIYKSINLKNTLILCETEDIISYIDSNVKYLDFLYKVYSIYKLDPNFFLLKNYIEVIQIIISHFRFDENISSKEYKDIENKIIGVLNELKEKRKDKSLVDEYLKVQSSYRFNFYSDEDKILTSIAYDNTYLNDANIIFLTCNLMSKHIISTVNYLLNVYPEVFKNDEELLNITVQILEKLKINKNIKRKVKMTLKNIKNI